MHCEDSEITNTNSLPCLQMTSIANQNKKGGFCPLKVPLVCFINGQIVGLFCSSLYTVCCVDQFLFDLFHPFWVLRARIRSNLKFRFQLWLINTYLHTYLEIVKRFFSNILKTFSCRKTFLSSFSTGYF